MFSCAVVATVAVFCAFAATLAALHWRAALARSHSAAERLEASRDALELRQAELDEDLFAANARLRDAALARRADHRRLERSRRILAAAARRRLAARETRTPVVR